MNRGNLTLLFVACSAAGFVGGILSPHVETVAAAPEIVRASAYELVNASGDVVARWDVSGGGVRIQFLAARDHAVFDLGADENGRPFVLMNGKDTKNRVALTLDQYDKPSLVMSDEKWQGRIHLGFVPPDTIPYGDWDHWGIVARALGSEHPAAGLMVVRQSGGKYKGSLQLDGRTVPLAPSKR